MHEQPSDAGDVDVQVRREKHPDGRPGDVLVCAYCGGRMWVHRPEALDGFLAVFRHSHRHCRRCPDAS